MIQVEAAVEGASGLTEMEIRSAPLPEHVAVAYSTPGPAACLAVSADGELLAVAHNGHIYVHAVSDLRFRAHTSPTARLALSADDVVSLEWSRTAASTP